ncbi:MAG: hypothetical protein RIQ71_2705 [Verrucomicrobiota bacterium]|jgi:autotransporter-associated beta strand protein
MKSKFFLSKHNRGSRPEVCPLSKSPRLLAVAAIAVLINMTATAFSQKVYTWTGGGGPANQQWSKNNNWFGVGAPSDYTTNSFVFGGAWREFAPDNDRLGLAAASIVFATNASTNTQSYSLTGNTISLVGGVTNLSTRWHTISLGLVLATNAVNFDTASNNLTLAGVISGTGTLVKSGAHTLFLAAANNYSGGTLVRAGTISGDTASIRGNVTNNGTVIFDQTTNGIYASVMTGTGTLRKSNAGMLTLSALNTFTGALQVQGGTVELAAASGAAAGSATQIAISGGARLLLSHSQQVNDAASVTLSGGTIIRATGVSEIFGNLNLTQASFLDFGTGAPGALEFGSYTPGALLTVNNFFTGNVLSFKSDLSSTIGNNNLFKFDGAFASVWNAGAGTFTITAIPEPAAFAASAGLFCLLLWPSRRFVRDVQRVIGLRLPMRDRLAARRR